MADYWSIVKTFGGGSKRVKVTLYPPNSTPTTELPIPPDAILDVSRGEEKFEKSPVKIPETSERTIEWNLQKLDELETTLRTKIFNPLGPQMTPWSIYLANVWVISDDGGNGALAEADFIVRFIGLQKDVPDAEGKKNLSASKFTIELVSIWRYIIEGLEPYFIARQLTGYDTAFLPSVTTESTLRLWDSAYQDSNSLWVTVLHSSIDADIYGNVNFSGENMYTERRYTMFLLDELFEEIRLTIQYVWQMLLPGTPTVTWAGAHDPVGNMTFYKQNYAADDGLGSSITGGNDIYYLGRVESRKYHAVNNAALSSWTDTGGALHNNGGKGWLAAYTNLWDLLGDLASTFGAKLSFGLDGLDGFMFWQSYRESKDTIVTITQADFYDDDITWKKGEFRIRGCTAQISGERGITKTSYYKPGASENRDSGTIKALFNNCPATEKTVSTLAYSEPMLKSNTASHQINGYRDHLLFYKDTAPAWLYGTTPAFVRMHHHVSLTDGVDDYTTPLAIARTDYNTATDNTAARALIWADIIAYGQRATLESGLPYRMAYVNTQMLSNETMVYSGKGARETFPLEKIGDSYSFDATIITAAFSGLVSSECWLIEVKEATDELNDFTLLSIGV